MSYLNAVGILVLFSVAQAQAQTPNQKPAPVSACPSQQELEQALSSDGRFIPDDCRQLSITSMSDGRICVLDFRAGSNPGVLDRLADAAVPTQWWVACERLKAK